MFENRDFADVTVIVGEDEEPFRLHRSIIFPSSKLFKDELEDGSTLEVLDIHVTIFQKIIEWQYEQGYQLSWSSGHGNLQMFETAHYFKIETLRHEILKNLSTQCSTKLCGAIAAKTDVNLGDLVRNFAAICKLCDESDLEILRPVARGIVLHWDVTPNGILENLNSGAYGHIFVAVMMGIPHDTPCGHCGFRGIKTMVREQNTLTIQKRRRFY
ncbi:hypothetical protein TWF506_004389 [Arthrobotrys conoides]|uniref:BTB domain-containing protein n=1 Tax=Arthrobotrys conoides TaxID=74498 RepID=A0AAN8NBM8_9PEZI